MQDVDLYQRRNGSDFYQHFDRFDRSDPEFFSRMSNTYSDHDYNRKKASGLFTLILALVIISFTTGLVVGIKFAGGSDRKIVDDKTMSAMQNISSKVSDMIKDASTAKPASELYPKAEYPFVIQLSAEYSETDVRNVAQLLSSKGHTVIISQNNGKYRVFLGPYKNENDAKKTLSEISLYKQREIATNAQIIRRM